MQSEVQTEVLNLMDGRIAVFSLSADMAVVAAYEQFEKGNFDAASYLHPTEHPHFREHRLGYSCEDWIAYRETIPNEAVSAAAAWKRNRVLSVGGQMSGR